MSHSTIHAALQVMGATAGVIGIVIAIYLELLSRRDCDPQYVVGFFILGSGLLLAHVGAFKVINMPLLTWWVQAVGYALLILGELYAGRWVVQKSDLETPGDAVEEVIGRLRN